MMLKRIVIVTTCLAIGYFTFVQAIAARSANRSVYRTIEPAEFAQRFRLTGYDPRTVALDLFAEMTGEREGRQSEGFTIDYHRSETAFGATVQLTVVGLADDSIAAQRFQVELEWDAKQDWQLVWVGEQWRCQDGRGIVEWTNQRCS
ncbi:MAG: hypothetical protein AAGG51_06415 [Cyanobacteria bacterium P01_G01_bin.54]